MQKVFYVFLCFIGCAIFACVLPYPIFSSHTNITEKVAYNINNHSESEFQNTYLHAAQVLHLTFPQVNALVMVNSTFEIFDLQTKKVIKVLRVGGQNHMDVQPIDKQNAENLFSLNGWTWQRRPVIVKLTENAYVPASLATYPHGYNKLNTTTGHFCLHFLGSKTDGTCKEDFYHQKSVKKAMSEGQRFINSLDN